MMKKLIGRSDISCTIFVPWDCNNHCAFCNTKNEYKNSKCTNLDNIQKIKQSIIEVASMPSINAYTFTGGESFLKEGIHINLRADYNHITPDTLGAVANDRVFNELMEISSDYLGHSGCLVCRTDVFDTPYGLVYYHRGTPVTSLTIGDKLIINDLVIKQTGQLFYDWPESALASAFVVYVPFSLIP